MAGLPAVVWLGYTVHGNELSGSDSAMLTAYHLLAARNQKMVADVLVNTVILIDQPGEPASDEVDAGEAIWIFGDGGCE